MPVSAGAGLNDGVLTGREIREVQPAVVALVADIRQSLGLGFALEGKAGPADALTILILHEYDKRARTGGDGEIDGARFAGLDVDILRAGVQESRQLDRATV